jgi:amino acid adenylation domain-containing protein
MSADLQYGADPAACLASLIEAAATERPRSTAVESGGDVVTYSELWSRAGVLASRLSQSGHRGVDPVVAVCLPRSPLQIVALLAAWRAGMAYLPLDPSWPEARLAQFVCAAGCAAVIAPTAAGTKIAGTAPLIDPYDHFATSDALPSAASPNGLAYVIFTSGSTGVPKAVEVTHANLSALVEWHVAAFGLEEGCRTSHLAGLGFDASAWEVWPTLAAGGTIVLAPDAVRHDAGALRDWLVAERVETAFAPTALAEPLVRSEWPATTSLRTLLTGADRLTVRPRPGLPFAFVNNYGPTECTVVATSGVVVPEGDALPSIGRPIAGTHVHLLDERGEPVPAGTGEIWIGGAQVARGYRGDPELTAARFVDDPRYGRVYRTGDLGRRGEDGEIAFAGRVDAQVKVRGHRIEPAEIAAALNRVAGVQASVVRPRGGELVAYVVLAAGTSPVAADLRAALAVELPDYMIPARFASLDRLPLTANGKVDYDALPDPAIAPMPEAPAGRAPATPAEKRLLAIVREVVGRDDVGVDDDFFLVGGHSLLGTQVVVRAREAFGVELTLFHLFEGRTAATLATIVEGLVIEKLDAMSDEEVRRRAAG